jgi:hypothetical protein
VGQDTSQIEREIRGERDELGRNLHELQSHAKSLVDWRTHYRNHTGVSLAVAFGGGALIALMATRRASGARHVARQEAPWTERRPVGYRALKALDRPRAKQQVGETWDHVLESLVAVLSAKAVEAIGSFVPGFREEYSSRTLRNS